MLACVVYVRAFVCMCVTIHIIYKYICICCICAVCVRACGIAAVPLLGGGLFFLMCMYCVCYACVVFLTPPIIVMCFF